jgi:hypothetical protein
MENRNGLVVGVEVTYATGTAEREAAKAMVKSTINKQGGAIERRTTRHNGYRLSLKIRKRIEAAFG